ncbi:hypothetical protein [Hydrogenimonas urashimensis]|uniref:hypothetical protein n=1 Tax=Hydrogenimonas urashimensis TaxID=2740515 RepID=UPI0019168D07|nr:hypothetical protein [Hydrogenimonas urashimensis]
MKKVCLACTILLLLSACGGGSSTGTGDSDKKSAEVGIKEMQTGVAYVLHEGDTIVKKSDNTVVLLETDALSGETTATLQSGSATIE